MRSESSFWAQNYFNRSGQIVRDPIRLRPGHLALNSGPNANRTQTRVMGAFNVDLLVTYQKRTRKIDLVISRRLYDHSGRGLAASRRLSGSIRAKVSCVD